MSPAIGELVRVIEEPWVFLKACVGGHDIPYDRGFGERFRAAFQHRPAHFLELSQLGRRAGADRSSKRDDQGDARRVRRHGVYGRFRRPRAHSRNMPMTATRMRGCALREIEAARRRGCKRGLPWAAWYRAWKCWMSSARLPADRKSTRLK